MFADIADDKGKSRLHQQIDENLKRVYEQDATQQIPDKFLELLEKLRDNGFDQGNPA